jgi:catechol 2,3-dioxygenase-like lactoylglutathione lyase family enzyme
MQVNGLDHVNIVTDDLEGTAGFYEELMGLRRGDSPGAAMGMKGAWMFDASDHAIVHLVWRDPTREFGKGHEPGAVTGAVHHVAFRCRGFDATIERLQQMGKEYRVNDLAHVGLRQIFVSDPNNINLELNFPVE